MNKFVNSVKESVSNLTTIPKYFLIATFIANLPYMRDFFILPEIVAIAWSPWTLITNTLVSDFYSLPLEIIFILFSLKYFENVWGTHELTKYVTVTTIVSQIMLIMLIILSSFIMGAQILFNSVYGYESLIFGLLVAYKQLVPEHRVLLIGGFISFRTKVLPILAMSILGGVVGVCMLVDSEPYHTFYYYSIIYLQAWSGMLSAWGYLRFYQRRDGIQGDRSETFSILSFFPESLHKWLSPASNALFDMALRIKIIPESSRYAPLDDPTEKRQNVQLNPPELFSEEADADRRRALGLKALENKMAQN